MGWKRINGREYYYKSERVGGRVKSTYYGTGETASIVSVLDEIKRAEQVAEHHQKRAEREEADEEEQAIADWFEQGEAIAKVAMIAAGFHQHKGQWRRKRK